MMQNKKGIGKKIGGFFLKTMAFLLTAVLALAATLLLTLNMDCCRITFERKCLK